MERGLQQPLGSGLKLVIKGNSADNVSFVDRKRKRYVCMYYKERKKNKKENCKQDTNKQQLVIKDAFKDTQGLLLLNLLLNLLNILSLELCETSLDLNALLSF